MPRLKELPLNSKWLSQPKFKLIQTDFECIAIQESFRLRETPTMALVSDEWDGLQQVWVSYGNAPWLLDAMYQRVYPRKGQR